MTRITIDDPQMQAEINSPEELEGLQNLLGPIGFASYYWIGATDAAEEGNFVWGFSGEPLTYSNWAQNQPQAGTSFNCAWMVASGEWTWTASDCAVDTNQVLCEAPKGI